MAFLFRCYLFASWCFTGNPFCENFQTISYDISRDATVTVAIYRITGGLPIAVLHNSVMQYAITNPQVATWDNPAVADDFYKYVITAEADGITATAEDLIRTDTTPPIFTPQWQT